MNTGKFFTELKRRHVYRAAVAYLAVAWVLVQVVTQVGPYFEVPNWLVRALIVALAIGFPIALVVAWVFQLTPQGLVREEEEAVPEREPQRALGRKIDFAIIGVLMLAVALLLFDRLHPRGPHEKSIAVLPFENLSDEKENAFFADGLQDDLLTNLARIKDLRVISRTSVMAYRDQKDSRNLREIGEALGAASILEGSVRRAGDRVVVNAQLINALTDQHLWANRYDRPLADSLGIEGELAGEIAEALRVTLTSDEKTRVAQKPTENADAYDLYLRALPYEQGPDTLLQDYRRAEELYRRAIELDPKFALAHARLASTCAEIFHFHEPLDSWKTRARNEAETAQRLQPNLGEAHFALGQCSYWLDHDYEKALTEFATAQQLLPNDTSIGVLVAAIQRRQGHWEECLATYEKIQKLDPQNPNIVRNLIFTNTAMRRWPDAARWSQRLRHMAPDSMVALVQNGYIDFWWKGEIAPLKNNLSTVAIGTDPDGIVTAARWEAAMIERDFDAAEKIIASTSLSEISYATNSTSPLSFFSGAIALARGDAARAATLLEDSRVFFEKALAEASDDATRHANLGIVYAFMGRRDDALREGNRAVELNPLAKDAVDGALMLCYLALIEARVGETDQSITLLERLLKTPGAMDSADYSVTVNDLKFRWEWDPLRKDPRFQKLIGGP